MRPVLLPLAERAARYALQRRGVTSRRLKTPLGAIHAYDAPGQGTLPTMVLLHGIASAATPFAPVLTRLAKHSRRVIAPEYPDHGFSDRTRECLTPEVLFGAMSSVLDELIDEPAIVIGNSLGGALALQYAIASPAKVRALVLVSPAGAQASDQEWDEIKSTFAVASRADATAFLKRLYHRPPWFLSLLAHELPASLRRRGVRDLLKTATNDDVPAADVIGRLSMPVLLLWGRSERILPAAHFDYFARHLPKHAVIEQPEGFGHCPHFDDPQALADRIVGFARVAAHSS